MPGYKFIVILPPKGPGGDRKIRTVSAARWEQAVALSSKIKDPVTAIKWFDYRYSSDGVLLEAYGIEGKTFTYVNGKPQHVEAILKDPGGRVPSVVAPQDYGLFMPNNAKNEIIVPEFVLEQTRLGYEKIAKAGKGILLDTLPILPYTRRGAAESRPPSLRRWCRNRRSGRSSSLPARSASTSGANSKMR